MLSVVFVAACLALSATAVVIPREPATGLNFLPGGECEIIWDADTTGRWTQTYIQLMTGSDNDMRHLTTLLGPFDGTNTAVTSYTYPCPDVTIHAPVLFLQFTSQASFSGTDQAQWTSRFSISQPADLVAAPLTDAAGTPYGIAELVNPAAAIAAPPTAPGGTGEVPTASTPDPGATSTPGDSQNSSDGGTSTTGNGHAAPGPLSPTRTNPAPGSSNSSTTDPDAAVSHRSSVAALFAAAAAAVALL